MPLGRARYGVGANPFAMGLLNPFRNPTHSDARLALDGFKQLSEVRAQIKLGRERGLPVFILITGPKGSGRSSFEHATFQAWCEMSNVEPRRFAQVRAKASSESEDDLLRDWAGQLAAKLQAFRGLPAVELITEINSAIAISNLIQLKARIQSLLPRVFEEMLERARPAPYGIGACFVDVRQKMVDNICSLFQDTPKICVITASEREPFGRDLQLDTEGLSVGIELGPLSLEEIGLLSAHRWGNKTEVPFEVAAVQEFFKGRNSYVGVVLARLASLFEAMCNANEREGGSWPDDRSLYFESGQVTATLLWIERGLQPR